jgi:hypothetical protein
MFRVGRRTLKPSQTPEKALEVIIGNYLEHISAEAEKTDDSRGSWPSVMVGISLVSQSQSCYVFRREQNIHVANGMLVHQPAHAP